MGASDNHFDHAHGAHEAHDNAGTPLTKNQALVYTALCDAAGPLSAYTILDRLREDGLRAPLQVYRALERLVEAGMVHRLESLNAFVACRRPDCASHSSIAFAICESCGTVAEVEDDILAGRLTQMAQKVQFALSRSIVEMRGQCAACQSELQGSAQA